MEELTDLHCHVLPYVDDGAENLNEAMALLRLQAQQGVTTIIATPHCRAGMFTSPDEKIAQQFARLQQQAQQEPGLPRLLLGREYFCDSAFAQRLAEGTVQTLGGSPYLLMEFSGRYSLRTILHYLHLAAQQGYRPVVAHAERYGCLQAAPQEIDQLLDAGAWVQINAGSLLGEEGWRQKLLCRRWLKADKVHLVCSDAHHVNYRAPNLGKAAQYIEKRRGSACAKKLLWDNPRTILQSAKREESLG